VPHCPRAPAEGEDLRLGRANQVKPGWQPASLAWLQVSQVSAVGRGSRLSVGRTGPDDSNQAWPADCFRTVRTIESDERGLPRAALARGVLAVRPGCQGCGSTTQPGRTRPTLCQVCDARTDLDRSSPRGDSVRRALPAENRADQVSRHSDPWCLASDAAQRGCGSIRLLLV
jgi:hypothetical protein